MRVLQLGKFYPVEGGVEKVMLDIVEGLSAKGVPCDMLCASVDKKYSVHKISDNNKIICAHTPFKLFSTMISFQMVKILKRIVNCYDIVHIHHPDPMAALSLRLSGYKGKVVLHWHSDIIKQKKMLKLYLPLQNWLIRRSDIILGTTPVYLKHSSYLKDVQDKCVPLTIGIDPLRPGEDRVRAIRDKYKGKTIVFSLGRLVHYKGYKYLIEAAKHLGDNYLVLIGGNGPLKDELQKQILNEGVSSKVVLLGRVPDQDLSAYYGACDVFCLSSIQKTEAFAIVQIEAMSCGKPVISCDIKDSGVPWVNKSGFSGLVVEPCDSKALAKAIHQVIEDKALYEQLSYGAKKRFEELFTKERMINDCYSLYQRLSSE